jgi:hypothetical protein
MLTDLERSLLENCSVASAGSCNFAKFRRAGSSDWVDCASGQTASRKKSFVKRRSIHPILVTPILKQGSGIEDLESLADDELDGEEYSLDAKQVPDSPLPSVTVKQLGLKAGRTSSAHDASRSRFNFHRGLINTAEIMTDRLSDKSRASFPLKPLDTSLRSKSLAT